MNYQPLHYAIATLAEHSDAPRGTTWEYGSAQVSPARVIDSATRECVAMVYMTDQKTRKRTAASLHRARMVVAAPVLLELLEGLLGCSDLNLESLDESTIDLCDAARDVLSWIRENGIPGEALAKVQP